MAKPKISMFKLVQKAQKGDRAALGQLFDGCKPRLRAVLADLMGEGLKRDTSLEDVLQETFTRACEAIDSFQWREEDSFLRWLSVIGRNAILEAAKRKRGSPEPLSERDPSAGEQSPSHGLRRQERFNRLQDAINRLSPDHRQVIQLARIQKLPLKEVAAKLGRSHAGVRQLLRRALQQLKEGFGDTESLGLPPRRLEEGEADGR